MQNNSFSATRKVASSARTGDSFNKTNSSVYLGFTLYVEKAIALYYCIEVFELVFFYFRATEKLAASEKVQELGVQRKHGVLFAPDNPFH